MHALLWQRCCVRNTWAIWALALGGLYLQHQWTLPLPVRALLLPAYAVEGALKGIALKLTKDDFDSAEKAKRGK